MIDLRKTAGFDLHNGRVAWSAGNLQLALKTKRGPLCLLMRPGPGGEGYVSVRGGPLLPLAEGRVQRDVAKVLVRAGFEAPPKELARRPLDLNSGGTL